MKTWLAGICFICLTAVTAAVGQPVPTFFGGGAVAYDPEISTIPSGAILSSQATVSADQKYVTINMQASTPKLQSLQTFPVSTVLPQGFVGGANLNVGGSPAQAGSSGASVAGSGNASRAPAPPSPEQIERQAKAWILARQGIYLVKPLP